MLKIRAGYQYRISEDNLKGVSLGVGLRHNGFNFDYSIKPFNTLGISHYISFGTNFEKSIIPEINLNKIIPKRNKKIDTVGVTESSLVNSNGVVIETVVAGLRNKSYRVEYSSDGLRIFFRMPILKNQEINISIEKTEPQIIGSVAVYGSYKIAATLDNLPANTVFEFNIDKTWMETNDVYISQLKIFDDNTKKFIIQNVEMISDAEACYRIRVNNFPIKEFSVVFVK
ncbi:MAG: hypothetical protein A3J83_02385 [Elusimicrobia bacterium RIFOXYA2_FULL_40_6]|nr:MAG: hypothetical protein A3J83_02385 [Elusimicrobia bacterium RIFOXYA2_FULL_40_6]